MNRTPIRTLIVDDESPARQLLRQFLAVDPAIEIIGECADGVAAVNAIESLRPELVMLDIEMPELDGFGVLQALDPAHVPDFIFVTAYDQYAVQAFEKQALDYLLKPFDEQRLALAMERAKQRLAERDAARTAAALARLLEERPAPRARSHRILVRDQERFLLIRADEIAWAEVDGNYVTLHAGAARYQLRQTLDSLAAQLDPARFQRIQRSVLLNLDFVREVAALTRGDYLVTLRNGMELKLNRNYRAAFSQFIGASL